MKKFFKLQKDKRPLWKNPWVYLLIILISPIIATYINNYISFNESDKLIQESQALIEKSQKSLAETERWLAEQKPKLELQSWDIKNEYGFTIAEGEVRNISDKKLDNIEAVVSVYTKDKVFISSNSALIKYQTLLPNQTSPFKVTLNHNPLMDYATVEFKELLGDIVRHKNKEKSKTTDTSVK